MSFFKLIRAKHYIKNLLVFFPLFFSGNLLNWSSLLTASLAFVAFCALSSVIYIINDIKDAPLDRNHPQKCNRPIASGKISVTVAIIIALIMLAIAVVCNFFTKAPYQSWIVLGIYFLVNIAYSLGVKNIPIIDILFLASGFVLRIIYGSCVTAISISDWLYLAIMSISLYLGLGKRRNEFKKNAENENINQTRKVLDKYNYNFLDKFMYVCLATFIVFYSLWCIFSDTIDKRISIFTIPIVIAILMRYSLNVEGNSDGDPVEVVLKDKWLIFMSFILAVMFFLMVYVF